MANFPKSPVLLLSCLTLASALAVAADRVTVDDTDYVIGNVLKCEPHRVDGMRFELELQGLHRQGDVRGQIDVLVQSIGSMRVHDVSWSGPEGTFSFEGMPNEELFMEENGRVWGRVMLEDAYGGDETVTIDFDLGVPDATFGCR